MIEIKCAAPDAAVSLCERAGVEVQTVLAMTEREHLLGFACMTLSGEEGVLSYLEAPDASLTDALLRAALNNARSAGVKTARIVCQPLRLFMTKKGYLTETAPERLEIAEFFAKSVCKA